MATLSFRFRNIRGAFRELDEEARQLISEEVDQQSQELVDALVAATPIDTGEARRGWRRGITTETLDGEANVVVFNEVDYIDDLNRGTSRQAGARFIENTALRFFTPVGQIVERR